MTSWSITSRRRILLILSACFLCHAATPVQAGEDEAWSARVVWVLDGDSLIVRRDGRKVTIRLEGIDSPEKGQAWADRARTFAREQALGQQVRVRPKERDRHGRTVARVFLDDGRDLGLTLVRSGLAWWYRRYSRDPALKEAEQQARADRVGLWSDPEPVPPWKWKRQQHRRRGE